MKTLDEIKSKCRGMSLRKDLPDFVRTDSDCAYYEGYIDALKWVMRDGDNKQYDKYIIYILSIILIPHITQIYHDRWQKCF